MPNEQIAGVQVELELSTAKAKEALQAFAKKASGEPVEIDAKPSEKSLSKFAEAFSGKGTAQAAGGISQALGSLNGGIQGAIGGITQLTSKMGAWGAVIAAVIAVFTILFQDTDTMAAMTRSFNSILVNLKHELAPVIAILGDILIPAFDLLARLMKPVGQIITAALAPALEGIMLLVDIIMQLLEPFLVMLEGFTKILAPLANLLRIFLLPLFMLQGALEKMNPMLEQLASAFDAIGKAVEDLVNWILSLFGIPPLETSTSGEINKGTNSRFDAWDATNATQVVADNTGEIAETSSKILSAIENVSNAIKGAVLTIKQIFDPLFNWIDDFFADFKAAFQELFAPIKEATRNGLENIFSSLTNKEIGVANDLFNEEGRWGDGYQFGDIIGTLQDLGSLFIGKGWLWGKKKPEQIYFESGGTIGAQVWAMSESGNPEFLFNSGGYDSVINANALENAMYSALVRAGAGNSPQKIEVTARQGSVRTFVQTILPELIFQLKGRV